MLPPWNIALIKQQSMQQLPDSSMRAHAHAATVPCPSCRRILHLPKKSYAMRACIILHCTHRHTRRRRPVRHPRQSAGARSERPGLPWSSYQDNNRAGWRMRSVFLAVRSAAGSRGSRGNGPTVKGTPLLGCPAELMSTCDGQCCLHVLNQCHLLAAASPAGRPACHVGVHHEAPRLNQMEGLSRMLKSPLYSPSPPQRHAIQSTAHVCSAQRIRAVLLPLVTGLPGFTLLNAGFTITRYKGESSLPPFVCDVVCVVHAMQLFCIICRRAARSA